MQMVSGGAVMLLPEAAPGQSHAGRPGNFFFFTGQKAIDWLIIYSFFYIKFSAV